MAAAAILVALTSLVTAVLGTTLLRSYLLSRSDAQLGTSRRSPAASCSGSSSSRRRSSHPQALPTQFLVEVIGADGQDRAWPGGPLGAADALRLSAAQLSDTGTPFTRHGRRHVGGFLARSGTAAVRRTPSGHRLQSRRSQQHGHPPGDGRRAGRGRRRRPAGRDRAAAHACQPGAAGRIEAKAAAIAGGDLSRRIDHPAGNTEVGRLADAWI